MSSPLLLTITPNPSIDLLFETDRLVWEDANRMAAPRRRAGGQGINVLRACTALGGKAAALALLGGAVGEELGAMLAGEGHRLVAVPAEGETRVFVAVRERATGRSLLLNPRGPASTARSAEALVATAQTTIERLRPRWVACCGSVPPGVPPDTYARLVRMARGLGARVVVDCDGELLRLAAREHCDLLVPNEHEAGRLCSTAVDGVPAAAAAAAELQQRFGGTVCVTLGAAGAVLADGTGRWHAATPPQPDGSAVGAGDAFLAAAILALDGGAAPPEVLRRGVAAGAATLKSEGGDLLSREEYRRQLDRTEVRTVATA